MSHDLKNTRDTCGLWGAQKKLRNLGCDTKDDSIRQPVCGHSVSVFVEMYHNISAHIFLHIFSAPKKLTEFECTQMHWFGQTAKQRRQIKHFPNQFFSISKIRYCCLCNKRMCGGMHAKPIGIHKRIHTLLFTLKGNHNSRAFSLLGVASPLFKI